VPFSARQDFGQYPHRTAVSVAQRSRHGHWGCRDGPGGSAAGELAGPLFAQHTQVDGGPGAVGPPRLRDFGEGAAGAVPLGDLGVEPAFVVRQRVGGVRAADDDQLGSEWAKPFDLLHALDSLIGVECAQRRTVQQPVERCLGDRPQVLTLTARKILWGSRTRPRVLTWASTRLVRIR